MLSHVGPAVVSQAVSHSHVSSQAERLHVAEEVLPAEVLNRLLAQPHEVDRGQPEVDACAHHAHVLNLY